MDFHDPIASISHLAMAAWGLFAVALLLRLARGAPLAHRLALAFYGFSLVYLYACSGLYHGKEYSSPEQAELFRRIDVCGIFLLIAGSYAPLFAILLKGALRRIALGLAGVALAFGIALIVLHPKPTAAVLIPYFVAFAILGLLPTRHYAARIGWRNVGTMFLAAGVYASGSVCEVLKWPTLWPGWFGPHEILHTTDIAGSLLHYSLLVRIVAMGASERNSAGVRDALPSELRNASGWKDGRP